MSLSPDYVKPIEVVNRQGRLTKLGQVESEVECKVEREVEPPYHVMTNSQYVTSVAFNKKISDGSSKISAGSTRDSLVTSSLLKFTSHKLEDEEKGKLSGYILDDEQDNERAKHRRTDELFNSSSVVDSNDELTNLYKTISRKQILSKVQSGAYSQHRPDPHRPHLPPQSRPLAKILNMLHSVNTNENMYTSIPEDSVYQSLPTQTSGEGRWSIIFMFLIDWLQMTTITRNRSREK